MSDVGVAPAPSAPPPAPVNEAPINPNPVNTPAPIGSQAPDKPPGDIKRPENRREAIQRAIDKASKAEPAKARMGHNQPPEETRVERKVDRPPPIDLKKRPDDQPKEHGEVARPQERQRAEHGHFAPRDAQGQNAPQGAQPAADARQPAQPHRELSVDAPYSRPLPRMTPDAARDWHATPETVRGDMTRMMKEFTKAYEVFKSDHNTMKGLRQYESMAKEHGTTLQKALYNYVNMESKLRNDVVGGLDVIINNLNLRADDGTPQGRKLSLQDVAWHIVNQTPEQRQLLQSQNKAMAQSHQLAQAQQRIAALENQHKQMQYAAHFQHTRSAVDEYATAHPRVDELADLIVQEVKLGFDLDTAYQRADRLRPATAAQTRTNGTHAAQTRSTTAQTRTDKSISGAPDAGPSEGRRRSDKPVGRREAIANAMRRMNGAL